MPLPKCSGKFNVGCVDIMTKPSIIPTNFHPKSICANDLGSFIRLYFPCDSSCGNATSQKATWIPEPNPKLYSHAFAKYINFGSSIAGWILHKWYGCMKMEALSNVPVIDQPSWKSLQECPSIKENEKLPLVIFSHGLGAQRAVYSVFCTQLASEGFIVAAIEHRDGSASTTFTTDDSGSVVEIPYFSQKTTTPEEDLELMKLRSIQLEKRTDEVISALDIMEKLDSTPEEIDNCINTDYDMKVFKGRIDTTCPLMMGHSFGGVTVVNALKKEPRLKCGIGLDPWCEPLLDDFFAPNNETNKPMFIIFTEYWNFRKNMKKCYKYMEIEKDFVEVVTLKNARHYDQCDIPAIMPSWIANVLAGKKRELIPFAEGIEAQRKLIRDYVWKFFETKGESKPVKLLGDNYDLDDVFMLGSNIIVDDV